MRLDCKGIKIVRDGMQPSSACHLPGGDEWPPQMRMLPSYKEVIGNQSGRGCARAWGHHLTHFVNFLQQDRTLDAFWLKMYLWFRISSMMCFLLLVLVVPVFPCWFGGGNPGTTTTTTTITTSTNTTTTTPSTSIFLKSSVHFERKTKNHSASKYDFLHSS